MVKASDIVVILVAIICPPAGVVFISRCSADLLINICLTLLGFIPGHIHAFWVIYQKMQAEERRGQRGSIHTGSSQHLPRDEKPWVSTADVNELLDVANDVLSATSATDDEGIIQLQLRNDQRPASTVNVEKLLGVANDVLSAMSAMGDDGSAGDQ